MSSDVKTNEKKIIDMIYLKSTDLKDQLENAYPYDIWYGKITLQADLNTKQTNAAGQNVPFDADKAINYVTLNLPFCVFFIQKKNNKFSLRVAKAKLDTDIEFDKDQQGKVIAKTLYDVKCKWNVFELLEINADLKRQIDYITAFDNEIKKYKQQVEPFLDNFTNTVKNAYMLNNLALDVIKVMNKIREDIKQNNKNNNTNDNKISPIGKIGGKDIKVKFNYNGNKYSIDVQPGGKTNGIELNKNNLDKLVKEMVGTDATKIAAIKAWANDDNNSSKHFEITKRIKEMNLSSTTTGGGKRKRIRRTMKPRGDNMSSMINMLSKSSEKGGGRKTKKRI